MGICLSFRLRCSKYRIALQISETPQGSTNLCSISLASIWNNPLNFWPLISPFSLWLQCGLSPELVLLSALGWEGREVITCKKRMKGAMGGLLDVGNAARFGFLCVIALIPVTVQKWLWVSSSQLHRITTSNKRENDFSICLENGWHDVRSLWWKPALQDHCTWLVQSIF